MRMASYELAASVLQPSEHLKLAIDAQVPVKPAPTVAGGQASSSSETADAKSTSSAPTHESRIVAVVSNVDAGWEQAAILVLRARASDGGKSASVVECIPIVKGLEYKEPAASETKPANSTEPPGSTSPVEFSLQAGQSRFQGTVTDRTHVTDLFVVISALLKTAVERDLTGSATTATSSDKAPAEAKPYTWLSSYTDHPIASIVAPIFSRFTSSAFASTTNTSSSSSSRGGGAPSVPVATQHEPGSTIKLAPIVHAAGDELKISLATFNINGQLPPAADSADALGLARWLRAEEEPDVLVVGMQEFDLTSSAYLYFNPQREEAWTRTLLRTLGRRGEEYVALASKQLIGMWSIVFVRKSLKDCFCDVDTASVGVGFGGFAGNKGAMGIRFRFRDAAAAAQASTEGGSGGSVSQGRTFCFVNAHLSAFEGSEALVRRRWDWNEIQKRLTFELDLRRGAIETREGIGRLVTAADQVEVAPAPPTYLAALSQMNSSPELAASVRDVPQKEQMRHRKWRRRWAKERKDWLEERRAWLDGRRDWADEKVRNAMRGQDVKEVLQKQAAAAASDGQHLDALRLQLGILDHDVVFYSGDLNYRIDLHINEVKKMVRKSQLSPLLRFDQLQAERSIGAVFKDPGWSEGAIGFVPTYKYDVGTNDFDTSEKQRTPAWCDRVLWIVPLRVHGPLVEHAARKGLEDEEDEEEDQLPSSVPRTNDVVQHLYTSEMGVGLSDHKPVLAVFTVKRD